MTYNPDDNLTKKTGSAGQQNDLDMRHIFNLTDEEAEQLKPTGLITAEDDFGGLLDDEPRAGEQNAGMKQTFDNSNPIYAYENIKDLIQDQKIDIFPLLLAYQTSQEKDWAKFIQKYRQQQGLDKKNLASCEGLLQQEIFPNIKQGENPAQFLDKVTERYKLEVVTLIYDYLENFRNNKARGEDLQKLISEGQDIVDALDRLEKLNLPRDKKDLILFINKYQQSKQLHPLDTTEDQVLDQNMRSIAGDLFAQGYRPEHVEVAIIAEIVSTKFQHDIIDQMLDRSTVDREFSMIVDGLSEEKYVVKCGHIRDEIMKKIMNSPENISTLQKRVEASPEANNFAGLNQLMSNLLAEEIQFVNTKQFEYAGMSEEELQKMIKKFTDLQRDLEAKGVMGLNNDVADIFELRENRLAGKSSGLSNQEKQQQAPRLANWKIVSSLLYLKNEVNDLIDQEFTKLANHQFEYGVMIEEEKKQRENLLQQIKSASPSEFLDVSMVGFIAQLTDSRFEVFNKVRDKYEEMNKKIKEKIYYPPFI